MKAVIGSMEQTNVVEKDSPSVEIHGDQWNSTRGILAMAADIIKMKKKKAPADTHRVDLQTDELSGAGLADHPGPGISGLSPFDEMLYRGDS